MADEKDFAKELNTLIRRYVDGGCDPQDIADELLREANYVFGHYNLEIYLEAKPIQSPRWRSRPMGGL
jgi:hypothetical protein